MRKPPMTPAERSARAKERRIAKESSAPPKESETAIQNRIIDALTELGCLVERRGEAQGRGGKGGGAFKTGEPDLRVSYRGLTFGVEVKRDANEPLRPKQIEWYRANAANVPYFVCCDHREAINAFHASVNGGQVWIGSWDCRVEPHEPWVVLK